MSILNKNQTEFSKNVFINCPFDEEYYSLLRPLLFTIIRLGFIPRIALEHFDSLENRLNKIIQLIKISKYSIHDLSRIKSAKAGEFSRMNMPFELGIEYGSRIFGPTRLTQKICLILEIKQYDFMKALSDLSGVDIKSHNNKPDEIVRAVRNWFVETIGLRNVPSATIIWYQFKDFALDFYNARLSEGFTDEDLNMMPIPEYMDYMQNWITGK